MKLVLVVAAAKNGVIGKDGDLPWRLPDDLKHFKRLTRGLPMIMGRKTWDSIGRKPLKGRPPIVVSSNPGCGEGKAEVVGSVAAAIAAAERHGSAWASVAGPWACVSRSLESSSKYRLPTRARSLGVER